MTVGPLLNDLRPLAEQARDVAQAWLLTEGLTAADVEEGLAGILGGFIGAAAVFTADWYNELAPESSYAAGIDDDLPDEKVANIAEWVFAGPQAPESRMKVAAHRLVFDAARRTVQVNVLAEGVAMARHEEAGCCNRCVARASTQAKARNDRSDDVDNFFHPTCEGVFVPVRKGIWEPPAHAEEWHERVQSARLAGNGDPEKIAQWLSAQ